MDVVGGGGVRGVYRGVAGVGDVGVVAHRGAASLRLPEVERFIRRPC